MQTVSDISIAEGLDPVSVQAIDAILQDVMAGKSASWPFGDDDDTCRIVTRRIAYHGVTAQIASCSHVRATWPDQMRRSLGKAVLLQRVWEESHRQSLIMLFDDFAAAGIEAVVMKGTALAYSIYDDPANRRRTDTDLLVRKGDLPAARQILSAQDYERVPEARICQETWWGETDAGLSHVIDLHWDVVNAPALNRAFDLADCFRLAAPLARLHPSAMATDPVTTFLHGCINQLLHRQHGFYAEGDKLSGEVRLIWHLDNHLLASGFKQEQWDDLATRAASRGLAAACLETLDGMARIFDTAIPAPVIDRFEAARPDSWVTDYIRGERHLATFMADWRASPDLRSRLALLGARLFPGRDQLRERFPTLDGWPLPALQALRLVLAPGRVLRRRWPR